VAKDTGNSDDFIRPLRRLLSALVILVLFGFFILWRIDSPRVERIRAQLVDTIVPSFEWALVPVTKSIDMVENFQSYSRIYAQNQELRRELRQMQAWKEAALQLEQKNAKLLDLNNVRLDPKYTYVTGVVMADSGSPFRQSVLLNIGARDGIMDGWATMDGVGLVGRISGLGANTARVVLLTDSNSRLPITIQPSGQRAILSGDNTARPPLEFIESPELVRPGDRVVSSGDGGVFPAGLLIGQVALGADRRLRVVLAADYERLDYLRVLRTLESERIIDPGSLILPEAPIVSPSAPLTIAEPPQAPEGDNG
jgi:rod shape-determining protein MreC